MVVVKVGDGLGNQIFNYICGYAVARKTKQTLCLDTSECDNSATRQYMLENFKLDYYERESYPNKTFSEKIYKRVRRNLKYKVIKEDLSNLYYYDERVFKKKVVRDLYLYGYWQNIQYYDMYKTEFQRQFQPISSMEKKLEKIGMQILSEKICAIHFRGGDIKMPNIEYFLKAVEIMEKNTDKVQYLIFTNDINQANDRLKRLNIRYRWITELGDFSDIEEFFLMCKCNNFIISDSTFSRCAALFGKDENKVVIAPKVISRESDRGRVYPKEWFII